MGLKAGNSADKLLRAIVAERVRILPFYGLRKEHKKVSIGRTTVRVSYQCAGWRTVSRRGSRTYCACC